MVTTTFFKLVIPRYEIQGIFCNVIGLSNCPDISKDTDFSREIPDFDYFLLLSVSNPSLREVV